MAGCAGSGLAQLLDEVWHSQLPRADRRYLCKQLCAARVADDSQDGRGDVILKAFEDVMRQAKFACGETIGIGKLRRRLLDLQLPDLATRLSDLNRARRSIAHPDVDLAGEVSAALLASCEGGDYSMAKAVYSG